MFEPVEKVVYFIVLRRQFCYILLLFMILYLNKSSNLSQWQGNKNFAFDGRVWFSFLLKRSKFHH